MAYETLLVEYSEHVATITLNRPDKRNSINTQMIADLQTALDAAEKTHARVVILTGAGPCCKPSPRNRHPKIRKIRAAWPKCFAASGAFRSP